SLHCALISAACAAIGSQRQALIDWRGGRLWGGRQWGGCTSSRLAALCGWRAGRVLRSEGGFNIGDGGKGRGRGFAAVEPQRQEGRARGAHPAYRPRMG